MTVTYYKFDFDNIMIHITTATMPNITNYTGYLQHLKYIFRDAMVTGDGKDIQVFYKQDSEKYG